MNTLSRTRRVLILKCLTEGMNIRTTARIAGVARQTVIRLLVDAGRVCAEYQDRVLRDLPCRSLEIDEVWCFAGVKEKSALRAKSAPPESGDVWTWTAICPNTRLVPSWRVGDRTGATAIELMDDLRGRLANRIQLTTDGHKACLEAVEGASGGDIDYTMLVRLYGSTPGDRHPASRYSPGEGIGFREERIEDNPAPEFVTTSHVERRNLTLRMSMRRFTGLTNAFSKKIENHAHAVALHFMNYNFCRIHQTLQVTPAMAAGVTDGIWEMRDIVDLIDESAPQPEKRGPCKKRVKQ